jgi:hypothetical protein
LSDLSFMLNQLYKLRVTVYPELRSTKCIYLISLYNEKQIKLWDTITTRVNIGHESFYFAYTVIFSCSAIENFTWIEIIIRGHLSYKTTFTLTQMWLLNTSLTALWTLSTSNLLVTNFCVLRRQIFGFYRLNWQIYFTCGLYLKFGLYRIPFHSRLCLDRFHCHIILQCPLSYFDYKYKKECYLVMNQRKLFWYLIIVERL